GYSLLYWALARGRVAGFEALIENGADLTKKHRRSSVGTLSEPSWDIIHLVLATKDTSFLEAALRQGFDPNHICSPSGKETLLYVAIDRHAYAAIQVLAEGNANMNCEDSAGYSPLAYAMTLRDYRAALLLLENGADPLVGSSEGKDIVTMLKTYGSRGVRPDQEEYFEKVVAELIHRGLITRQDIVEADKPKPSVLGGPPGVTVIEHPADSEAGRAIRQLDERERAATGRERK
ncbi:MAG: ankyrin repeat domain-containing protein, partial [Planctomycetia bacterium]